VITVSEHELSEIRGLIESRSGILFDESRERFLSAVSASMSRPGT